MEFIDTELVGRMLLETEINLENQGLSDEQIDQTMEITVKMMKAPFFFLAVGSQANVGGAASAPVVAAEFSPSLSSVGVLLAVGGYVVGTAGALFCAYLMEIASNF